MKHRSAKKVTETKKKVYVEAQMMRNVSEKRLPEKTPAIELCMNTYLSLCDDTQWLAFFIPHTFFFFSKCCHDEPVTDTGAPLQNGGRAICTNAG